MTLLNRTTSDTQSPNNNTKQMNRKRRFALSKCEKAILAFIWNMENTTKKPPFEADFTKLATQTSFSVTQIKRSCKRLVSVYGLLTKVHLAPFNRGRRIVFRIPYGQFNVVKEIVAYGNRAKPFMVSTIQRAHNPIARAELGDLLHLTRRTSQRLLSDLMKEGKVDRFITKEWTRYGWRRVTRYRLKKGFKVKPLTEWMDNYLEWRQKSNA